MSGGVDSAVAAALCLEEGHEVVGAYMKNWINEDNVLGDCPWMQDIEDARAVCDRLGVEFRVVNLMEDYKNRVVSYLLAGYQEGVTPNPDAMCNREMKFGVFLDYALEEGFEEVATGHYARLRPSADGSGGKDLLRGVDSNKDQSYFLALLQQHQISKARFPVGDLPKPVVRELAEKHGLPNAVKKDSQGICFIGEVKMRDFLQHYVEDEPGDIVTTDGAKVGEHGGLHLYTLGQRKGLGVPSNVYQEAYVVVAKRGPEKELVVAFDRPDSPWLYATRCRLGNLSWAGAPVTEERIVNAQPRYRSPAPPARFTPDADGGGGLLEYEEPQRALTPGQVCGLYDGELLLGGGFFEEICHEAEAGEAEI